MPNYNHAHYLPEALQALLDQTWLPTEIIVIDDGSTDDSVKIIERFAKDNSIIRLCCNGENRGVSYSLNRALDLASGDYVAFPGADDRTLPEFLEKCMVQLTQHPQAALCSGLSRLIDEDGKDLGLFPSPMISNHSAYLSSSETLGALRRYGSWFMGNTVVARRQLLIEAGGFRADLHSFSDGFVHMVLALKHGACFVPEPLGCWRRMGAGYSESVNADVQRMLDIRDSVVRLMRTTWRDLFPEDVVERWARSWSKHVGATAWNSVEHAQYRALEESFSRLLEPHRRQRRLLLDGARILVRTEAILMRLLIFATLADLPDWIKRKLWLPFRRRFK
jgi:glycosyltransferase involved in cell wall biosynthesis